MSRQREIDEEGLVRYLESRLGSTPGVDLDQVKDSIDELLGQIRKEARNRQRLTKIDADKDTAPAVSALGESDIERLPRWVRDRIDTAVVVGRSQKVVRVSDGRKYHLDNRLNDLSGAEWTYFLNSVFGTRYPTSGPESYAHDIRKVHPSPKPPQLMRDIIRFFTKEHGLVLDYFAGVGGTLLGAALAGRRAVGVELDPSYVETYRSAAASLGLVTYPVIVGDALKILHEQNGLMRELGQEEVDLVLIDPPYGEMMARPKTGEAVKRGLDSSATPFTDSAADLGNLDRDAFLDLFSQSVDLASDFLRTGGHLVVFIKDLQPSGKNLNLLHADLIYSITKTAKYRYSGLRIWADEGVNLYPYGYPYSFVANQIHQYILVFRKE